MNLNEDFISIQGIILSAEKSAESLKKIKYTGGNKSIILNIISELHKFFTSRNYIKDNKINDFFDNELKEICMFLILNTELKQPLDEPDVQHLINIMPQLSTCLLANVIVGLDLSKHYCEVLQKFDFYVTEELLVEVVPCLKKCKPRVHIKNSYEFLKLIILKLSVKTEKWSEGCEKLTDVASQMLLNLTGLHGEQVQDIEINLVYEYMGLTFLNLLNLLLMCDEKNKILTTITEKLLKTCCSIITAVTIDVFCSWAEIECDGEVLQSAIAGKSYLFIKKYQKNPLAKELVGMLGTIAQKPKTVDDLILQADVPKMISMINKADGNQKEWFMALLNTQVLECEKSVKCIDRWAHLCSVGDVTRLLGMDPTKKDAYIRQVVIKCASTLELPDLILVTTRHFYKNGLEDKFNDDIHQQLVLLFNKIKDKKSGEILSKELHLLLLQNPQQTVAHIFSECLKNTFYSENLITVWPSLEQVLTIGNFGIGILRSEIANNLPNDQTCKNHTELFNALISTGIFPIENLILHVIFPLLQKGYKEDNYQLVKNELEIIKDLQGRVVVNEENEHFFHFIFNLMKNCRCNFLKFDSLKQEVVKQTVVIIEKYCNMNRGMLYTVKLDYSDDIFTSFYRKKVFERDPDEDVLKYFFPINFQRHAETVAHLIKILPLCVTPEWILISKSLICQCGIEKSTELLCDVLILLCELIKSQKTKTEELKCMLSALKYHLQNVGVVVKECIQPRVSSRAEDISITRNICRLLKEIPEGPLKGEEGLSLASLLSDASLQSLKPDKKFACLVASIHETNMCKMLTTKILG